MITGHKGMVGSALRERLKKTDCQIISAERKKVDLIRQIEVERWMADTKPDVVFAIGAKVGGIVANTMYPGEFIYNNLIINSNVIHSAWKSGVEKMLFLGSNCVYPKITPQPTNENALLTGPLDENIQWYAIAKIAGVKMCQAYRRQYNFDAITLMPANLIGPRDNYDPINSHVAAGILRRMHEAKISHAPTVTIWGSGKAYREFLFVDDLADAMIFAMEHYSGEDILNVGSGTEIQIAEFAKIAAEVVGYKGKIVFDTSKPDGTLHKLLDSARMLSMGWKAQWELRSALHISYKWFLDNVA